MGFFGKNQTALTVFDDDIQPAPTADPEKQTLSHNESQTALPKMPPAAVFIDPEIEKRVLRKLDWRVPTLLGFLYLLSLLDRSNIGNAKIAGMKEDLQLDSQRYSWLLTIFYIAYTVFEFAALMWKVMPPHQWAAITVMAWGIVATCQAAAFNWESMMALRFLLGMAEAAFGPGTPYLLSFFYRRHELGLRCGMFVSAAPLANTFAGALAYGITSGHSKLANWRLLFLVEGCPSLIAAVIAWYFLPDHPSTARFLTEEEKEVARARGMRRSGEGERSTGIDWRDVGRTVLDAKAWLTALMYFSCNVSFSSLPVFLPTILEEMGFSSIDAQGLTAPPYFASFLVTLATTWLADRFQQRGLTIAVCSVVGAVGYTLLATSLSVGVRYLGVFLAAAGVFPCIANILPWVLNNQGSDTRRGVGIVILNLLGQCGPFLGTNIFPDSDAPRYIRGQAICAAFMYFTTLLALGLRVLLMWENRRLDQQHGTKAEREARGGPAHDDTVGEENYGAGFRYVLIIELNGIRFSITDLTPPTTRLLPTIYQDRAPISLYDAQYPDQPSGSNTRRPIPDPTITSVITHLKHFQRTCSDFDVHTANIHILATEATRTAPNSADFRARINAATGWTVRLLSKEEEGRIGALGIASSGARIAGLAMDLGGGSTQLTWVVEQDGEVRTCPAGAVSFPYGAAALMRRLGEGEENVVDEGKEKKEKKKDKKKEEEKRSGSGAARKQLLEEMRCAFREAYVQLGLSESSVMEIARSRGSFDLYLCGGGFRGWGYVLMKQAAVDPYPIPIINGFRVQRGAFHDTISVLDEVGYENEEDDEASTSPLPNKTKPSKDKKKKKQDKENQKDTPKIFGVSKRRASQIPAVALLVNAIMDALPSITHIQFSQGGVREGFLFDKIPADVRAQSPLLAATAAHAPPDAEAISSLLRSALPTTASPTDEHAVPASILGLLPRAVANMMFAHAAVPRESRSAAAVRCTTSGVLASAGCLSHEERALLALVLCERWAGDLAAADEAFRGLSGRCVSREEAWWARYLGRVAAIVGDVYPAGRVNGERVRIDTEWEVIVKKKGRVDVLVVKVTCEDGVVGGGGERLEKLGKKKNWEGGYGVKIGVVFG
ncbi:MFS general substrate transporter [Aspergillus campestris IBT 28561]|uniref:MFS general substrate transporter n=1 Tax=Aspergillus campestris (strain IBT 28561) TaxID=1392248 RepID=A0A2I1CZR3_ASPC2|nr:MFS general substrate transporter [Aspergillus campestris IBT 28561]PKY03109.1 MFS general substrate transporter [Aspergillus campestris IBT 28561]